MRTKHVPPRATRIMEGLRDTGYEFNTAMADLIDNSIAAGADFVDVHLNMDYDGEIVIYIVDNGCGMDEIGLENAMTYGSPQRPDPSSLGKFGLGLKTASTAFCRSLSVTTRVEENAETLKARWDLDHVYDWELQFPEPTEEELELLEAVTHGKSGTIVTWEKVDRLLKSYTDQGGSYARKAFKKIIDGLQEHVAMVFQRFLDEKFLDAPTVKIRIAGELIAPWDPFCLSIPSTECVAEQKREVEFEDGTQASFVVRAYVLPRKEEYPSEVEYKGAKVNNDMQGFYVYRENRLIHYGDWLGMFRNEPHGTLLRVEFSFTYELDDAFNVDIKKSRIMLNNDISKWIKESFLPAPRRAADERYRKGISKSVRKASKGAHDVSNAGIGSHENDLQLAKIEVTNASSSEVEVSNRNGRIRIKLPLLEPTKEGELFVQPADSIEDGMLWEPCMIQQHHAVRINTNHPYYRKVYVPNLSSGVTIQGMDSLLWALSEAELGTINDSTKRHFEELRFEVSRILRKLVEDLPEPLVDADEN